MAKLRVLAEKPPMARGTPDNQLRELRDYLFRVQEELEYLLTHLGRDNLEADLTAQLDRMRDGVANSLANQIVIESLTLPNTGSLSPNTTATVSATIPAKTGYAPVACVPGYAGDDQFCWVACTLGSDGTQVAVAVRNVSSSSDSGAPRVLIIYQKV